MVGRAWLKAAGAVLAVVLIGRPAAAETIALTAELSSANEVPPADSRATGEADLSYDTESHALTWSITYSGLSSAPTAAHFHGPANPGENASIFLPITELDSPVTGEATLTDDQAAMLLDGLLYLNFHTPAYPPGEIRGQVVRVAQ